MTKADYLPYYHCFQEWLWQWYPQVAFPFMRGALNAGQLRPYVLEWAKDITKKASK